MLNKNFNHNKLPLTNYHYNHNHIVFICYNDKKIIILSIQPAKTIILNKWMRRGLVYILLICLSHLDILQNMYILNKFYMQGMCLNSHLRI